MRMTVHKHNRPKKGGDAELVIRAFMDSPAAISIVSLDDWQYLEANEAFMRLTGLEREDVIGSTSDRVNIWGDDAERVRFAEQLVLNESVTSFETKFRRGDGSIVYGSLSARLVDVKGKT